MLSGFRALDLTDEKGFFCGSILVRLGVDVIKIEKPGGDAARNKGPFWHDIPDPERSLYWFAYNVGMKGITLNIESREGQDILRKLVKSADFMIESFPVGHLDGLNLGYGELKTINPRIILTSITPFGQTGPYRNYKASDIVAMATGGMMIITGEPGGLPVRLNPDHTYCVTGTAAAAATLLAHYYRENISGEGQHVDVAMHDCIVRENHIYPYWWELKKFRPTRLAAKGFLGSTLIRHIWLCQDGYVCWVLFGGHTGAGENKAFARWLSDEGIPGIMQQIDFNSFDFASLTQEQYDRMEKQIASLLSRHTKKWLEDEAIRRGIRLSAVNDIKEVVEHEQLKFRNFWMDIAHPELSASIMYPGHLFLSNEASSNVERRPALVGEHNEEIYADQLGFSRERIATLQQQKII